jgi:hypothetical protein
MVALLLFAVLAVTVVGMVGPSRLVRWMRQDVPPVSAEAVSPPASELLGSRRAGPAAEEELLEQVLTAERLAGIVSLEDYQRGMAVIAAKDAVSHPMALPPERM